MLNMKKKSNRGFTMLEVIISMAVVIILTGTVLVFTVVSNGVYDDANDLFYARTQADKALAMFQFVNGPAEFEEKMMIEKTDAIETQEIPGESDEPSDPSSGGGYGEFQADYTNEYMRFSKLELKSPNTVKIVPKDMLNNPGKEISFTAADVGELNRLLEVVEQNGNYQLEERTYSGIFLKSATRGKVTGFSPTTSEYSLNIKKNG